MGWLVNKGCLIPGSFHTFKKPICVTVSGKREMPYVTLQFLLETAFRFFNLFDGLMLINMTQKTMRQGMRPKSNIVWHHFLYFIPGEHEAIQYYFWVSYLVA